MRLFYTLAVALIASSITATAASVKTENYIQRKPVAEVSPTDTPMRITSRATDGTQITLTDIEKDVQGRYTCEYYSPIPSDVTGQPFGWCQEQPLIVEDYFGEVGDVNIGYWFFTQGIIKGFVDMEAGTITIPSRKVITYYEDPDDYDDPGKPVFFTTVDIADRRYVPTYDKPLVGKFELYNGIITKITFEDRWGFVVQNTDGSVFGWFEVGEHTTFYRGYGEMEYIIDGETTQQTVIHAVSNGQQATIYNAFRSGWETPITIDIDNSAKTASIVEQSVTFGDTVYELTDANASTTVAGIIRDVDWDLDLRDDSENSVLDFAEINLFDPETKDVAAEFTKVRFYFKDNVGLNTSGIENIIIESNTESEEALYNLAGIKVARDNATPGVYILRSNNKSSKIIIR